jgi:hypothetical protein
VGWWAYAQENTESDLLKKLAELVAGGDDAEED